MLFATVNVAPLPPGALLQEFVDSGEYTDCFDACVDGTVEFPLYVESFYTTWLFKAERLVLRLASLPSTDAEARQVARGERQAFAAWNEHARADNQLVMMDVRGQTCSWFMVSPDAAGSRLYFGSAVMRKKVTPNGRELKWSYRVLMGLHRFYSRALLSAARSRIINKR